MPDSKADAPDQQAIHQELLAQARKDFAADEAEEQHIRVEAREDIRFAAGRQWTDQTLAERKMSERPALTFNRLPTFISQVVNEARQNKLTIKFAPAEEGDKDTADIMEGLSRQVQSASNADVCSETALEYSTMGGFAYIRLLTDFEDDRSFNQEIKFQSVPDPFSVYGAMIPAIYGRKARHVFVVDTMSLDEFKAAYPGSEAASIGFGESARETGWVTSESVRVAEYWYLKTRERTLQLLSTGRTIFKDELKALPPGVTVEKERRVSEDTVHCAKINGVEVLEEYVWPGKRIPIFAVLGRQIIVDGRPELISMIRFLRDPQKLLNFYKSGVAEQLGMTSRAPFVMAEGQDEGYERMWQLANVKNFSRLIYKPITVNGQVVGPPQRNAFEAPIQALSLASAQAVDDLKSIAGIYDASLGKESNETSGIAITRRQQQSGLTNYHYIDNLTRAQEEIGRELAALIPKIYDSERMVRVLGEDGTQKVVKVNQAWIDEFGREHLYRLDAGKYDVRVSVGAAYTTKRQEAFSILTEMAKVFPGLVEMGGDVIFRNSDTPGAEELAERFKKRLPPELLDDEESPNQVKIPPQVIAEMQQRDQMIEQLTAALNQAQQAIETKQLETDSRERIERLKIEAMLAIKELEMGSAAALEVLKSDLAAANQQQQAQQQAQQPQKPAHPRADSGNAVPT